MRTPLKQIENIPFHCLYWTTSVKKINKYNTNRFFVILNDVILFNVKQSVKYKRDNDQQNNFDKFWATIYCRTLKFFFFRECCFTKHVILDLKLKTLKQA